MTTRRGFLQGILTAGMAPAIVKAEILMPVRKIIVPPPLNFWEKWTFEQEIMPAKISVWHAGEVDESMFAAMGDRMRHIQELIVYGVLKGRA